MFDDPTSHFPMKGSRMHFQLLSARRTAAAAFILFAGCRDSTAPDPVTRAATDLRLLTVPSSAPSLAETEVSFYAVNGKTGGADIWYHAAPGRTDSLKFLEFRVGTASLDKRPDGSTIAIGDSVLITLTVTDPTHFRLDFQPSGLTFSASDQPTLKLSFAACGADLNYDGKVDAADQAIMDALSFWRQEAPFQPWFKLGSIVKQDVREVDAQLLGFTGYALMY
jgi:hypothetical protein